MSLSKRYIFIAVVIFLATGALVFARWAMTVPWFEWRTAAINSYSVLPASTVRLELRVALQKNQFEKALGLLRRQRSVAKAIGFTNFMKHDLVENTGLVMRQASLVGKLEEMTPWLAELKEIAPREYRLLPMLALSQAQSNPEAADASARQAIAVLPIDEIPYRAMIKSSLAHEPNRLKEICGNFRKAQLGSLDAWYHQHNGAFDQDLRTVMFAVKSSDSQVVYGISHGLELGVMQTAEFNFDQKLPTTRFNLILPTIPGIKMTFRQVQFEATGELSSYTPEQLFITPAHGYVLSTDTVVLTSKLGENLAIQSRLGSFPAYRRITITYQLDKLAISSSPDCLILPDQ